MKEGKTMSHIYIRGIIGLIWMVAAMINAENIREALHDENDR